MQGSERPPGAGGDADEVFAALADPTRRILLDRLSADGPMSATELSRHFPVSRQAVVKHLGTLTTAGLLSSERRGREVLYEVAPRQLAAASDWLADVGARWDRRLEALSRQLDTPPHIGTSLGRRPS